MNKAGNLPPKPSDFLVRSGASPRENVLVWNELGMVTSLRNQSSHVRPTHLRRNRKWSLRGSPSYGEASNARSIVEPFVVAPRSLTGSAMCP